LSVGFAAGFGAGLGVGFGAGFGAGLGVGFAAGFGAALAFGGCADSALAIGSALADALRFATVFDAAVERGGGVDPAAGRRFGFEGSLSRSPCPARPPRARP
jgi:hypothetical protein